MCKTYRNMKLKELDEMRCLSDDDKPHGSREKRGKKEWLGAPKGDTFVKNAKAYDTGIIHYARHRITRIYKNALCLTAQDAQ